MKGMAITRNPLNFNRYQFLNRETQIETGLIDLKNRQYNPQTGRFTSQDPVIEGQEHLSLYQYGWNNPVLRPDPDGLEPCCGALIEFTTGFNSAIAEDFSILPTSVVNTQKGGSYAKGATAGHVTAIVLGAIETIIGGGGDLAAGVGELGTAGLATPVTLPVAALSTAAIVQGVSAVGKGISNLRSEGKYSDLKEPKNVGDGKKTTPSQRQRIMEENKNQNGGSMKSDGDGRTLNPPKQNKKAEKVDMNQAEVDHVKARSKGGSNSNSNQRLISKEENLRKGNREQ